jgi:hypothetical protein
LPNRENWRKLSGIRSTFKGKCRITNPTRSSSNNLSLRSMRRYKRKSVGEQRRNVGELSSRKNLCMTTIAKQWRKNKSAEKW